METIKIGKDEFTIVYDSKPTKPTFNAKARKKHARNRWYVYTGETLRHCLPTREEAIKYCEWLEKEFNKHQ